MTNFVGKQLVVRTTGAHHFAPNQVQRLDAVGAFVDLGDAHIAHQLLLAPFADVAMAAEYLLAVDSGLKAHVGQEGLGHWRQQRHQLLGAFARDRVFAVLGGIELHGHVGGKRATAFVASFHGQQHAAHVRVPDDRVGCFVLGLRAGWGAALQAVAGIGHGVLVRTLGSCQALDTHAQAFVVHHGEHGRQAFVRLADEVTDRFVEVHHAGGRTLDAHLVLDGAAIDRVTCAQAAIGVDQHLRHQKQRDTLGPGRCVRQLGQHQVDDVFAQVLLTTGDEDLGPADLIGTISLGFGTGANDAQVGAGMGFGQAHGTGPDAGIHVGQVSSLQFFAGMGLERQAGTGGQHWVEAERQVGTIDHFLDLGTDYLGHAHATVGRVTAHAHPAAFGKGAVGRRETVRRSHCAIAPGTALLVATAIERGNQARSNLAGFFEHSIGSVFIHHFRQGWHGRPQTGDFEDFIENEAHVAQGSFVIRHISNTQAMSGQKSCPDG
ncbi:hypothetical protein D9M71_349720 [compost metagenome]